MRYKKLRFGAGFHVMFGNRRAQAAEMVIAPGKSEGGAGNRHRGADQWLYVVSGNGIEIVGRKRRRLREGVLLLIEKKDHHEIHNSGRIPLRTLNVYVPPAYTGKREPLVAGRP
jgi:mannose-6-phosphate isomerase-like protein (cupin superfamily)